MNSLETQSSGAPTIIDWENDLEGMNQTYNQGNDDDLVFVNPEMFGTGAYKVRLWPDRFFAEVFPLSICEYYNLCITG